ncbi:30S ribosomal protein S17 [Chlamydia pecorum]|uniref:Small ribosomal subunit protein uS17 n=2 Tax=Chlamydia pecorum TaxID=85991 RepID=A0AA34RCV9_CHLPE|nr:30S ribosomal protein S17 [Chlamydia pecorum]AEB41405.1 ribosomal protein S17 [Chlamydia pecorum E58]AGW37611.1 30S ribosomal protein S17 [Chlamydia pecorum PV3056/3]AGW38532.1 30S ribosomal protein S17 [Chlamydia pecorum W73]AGW39457.1 30S ribosomal protein S17 [Chlamydia pecorum P787]KTF29164.1 30S ribosomal protein S17 [Chlamydia pecorum]
MVNQQRGARKTKIGVVVSAKMDKTVVVRVERICAHPQYAKVVRDSKKFYAHNDLDGVTEGAKVRIQETRPLSKLKRWRVIECIN